MIKYNLGIKNFIINNDKIIQLINLKYFNFYKLDSINSIIHSLNKYISKNSIIFYNQNQYQLEKEVV